MSGGHFDYQQYKIGEIADEIERLIATNNTPSKYGNDARDYDDVIMALFKDAVIALRKAEVYAQRIDWLVSGDDGEDSFQKRLAEDLSQL